MTRTITNAFRILAGAWAFLAAVVLASDLPPILPVVEVWRSPSCGCCGQWVKHLHENGFAVRVHMVDDTSPMRRALGIPERLGSCHTAKVAGYALEGHVPAKEVKRLLREKPRAVGLTVPGMPMGSPGMEGPTKDPFDVLLVGTDGRTSAYAKYGRTPEGPTR